MWIFAIDCIQNQKERYFPFVDNKNKTDFVDTKNKTEQTRPRL
tara:strand:- start:37680 stop:37808 length:129 start_codon:yes stop_codon:yes gene_type:complete